MRKLFNPVLIPVVSVPHFILGCFLTASNWNRLGYPEKAKNTVKWGIVGTIVVGFAAFYIPFETLKKMWSVGIGINLGAGMALRTLQLPAYSQAQKNRK